MNHKFQKTSNSGRRSTGWDLIITPNNKSDLKLVYNIYYNQEKYHIFIYKEKSIYNKYNHGPEIIQYLISNNICVIYKMYPDTSASLILNPHILLELI
jgi:hypothetical protein